MRGYNPTDIITLTRRRRVSVMGSVPKMLDGLRAHALRTSSDASLAPKKQSWPFRWWRYRHLHRLFGRKFRAFVVGAAPLDAELEEFWSARGVAVLEGYGLTETAPIVSVTHPFHIQAGSVGKAIAGVDVKIAPDGEILVRGENVTSGYFEAEAETAQAFDSTFVPAIGRFSDMPRVSDLDDLTLDQRDLDAIQRCRPGDCGLKLSAEEIESLTAAAATAGVEWRDAVQQEFRRLLVERVRQYRTGGLALLPPPADRKKPRKPDEALSAIVKQSPYLAKLPQVVAWLNDHPQSDSSVESFFYCWKVHV